MTKVSGVNFTFDYNINDLNPEIKIAVANAILAWSEVELFVGIVFRDALGNDHAADAIWDAIIGFETRAQVLNAIIFGSCGNPILVAGWHEIHKNLMPAYRTRHKIAHASLAKINGQTHLLPASHKARPNLNAALKASQIDEFTKKFIKLQKQISGYSVAFNDFQKMVQDSRASVKCPLCDRFKTEAQLLAESAPGATTPDL